MTSRFSSYLRPALVLLLLGGACTSSSAGEGAVGDENSTTTTTTTTPPAPVILALAPNLGLSPDQCFAEVPAVETTTPTTLATSPEPEDGAEAANVTEPTTPETLPETTTIPRPPTVAVVDCNGTNLGQVYAAFCLGNDAEAPGELTAIACPGLEPQDYPGDRTIRRAAARICLQRFEETFGEEYGSSTRVAQEFTPNEGVWALGDHRVVCHSVAGAE